MSQSMSCRSSAWLRRNTVLSTSEDVGAGDKRATALSRSISEWLEFRAESDPCVERCSGSEPSCTISIRQPQIKIETGIHVPEDSKFSLGGCNLCTVGPLSAGLSHSPCAFCGRACSCCPCVDSYRVAVSLVRIGKIQERGCCCQALSTATDDGK